MTGKYRRNLWLCRARSARNQTQQQVADAIGERLGYPMDVEYVGWLGRGVITWPNTGAVSRFVHISGQPRMRSWSLLPPFVTPSSGG